MDWKNCLEVSSFHTSLTVDVTLVVSRVRLAKFLMVNRKFRQVGSRGATQKVIFFEAQTWRWRSIWWWVSESL